MQYAIVNTTTQQTTFYKDFNSAFNACTNYPVQPNHTVYVIDFTLNKLEQL
jgi:hypothetical protein